MNTPHILAFTLVSIGLVLLLIQTARAAYWRGGFNASADLIRSLNEENRETRGQRNLALKEVTEMREYLQRLHERSLLATSEPELFNELMQANDMLRSFAAIVAREGADTNWGGLENRIDARLEAQQAMLYAAPVKV